MSTEPIQYAGPGKVRINGILVQNETPGEYIVHTESVGKWEPLVNSTNPAPDLLAATLADDLLLLGLALGQVTKLQSKRQWEIAARVNREWADLEREYRAEGVTHGMFLSACSTWLNDSAGWHLLAASGETLRRWCDVASAFTAEEFGHHKDVLSFDHFFKARQLFNSGDVPSPAWALDQADKNGWTAEEMLAALSRPPVNGEAYDWFARRLQALREQEDWGWLPAEDAAYIRGRLDEINVRLNDVAERTK